MATLAEMRAEVAVSLGNKAGMDATINNMLNEATLQLVMTVRPYESLEQQTVPTVNGTFAYDLAEDAYAIILVTDLTDTARPLSLRQGTLIEFYGVSRAVGRPTKWVRSENQIYLYNRVPDSVRSIEVLYLKRPATMTSSQDFPLNAEWVLPVIELATFLTFSRLNQSDKAKGKLEVYDIMLKARQTPLEIEDESPERAFMFPESR